MVYYTDGSAHPNNPGPGGFGVVIVFPDGHYETYSKQTDNDTTNNREEMKAILYAVCDAVLRGDIAEIYTDSSYAINTFSTWMYTWMANGWTKSNGQPPENLDIIKQYINVSTKTRVIFNKVKGHKGDKFNEMADQLARGVS